MSELTAYAQPELTVAPVLENYAEAPITEGFDWNQIIADARERRALEEGIPLYLVVFRSQLKPGVDTTALIEHDDNAHAAALESPDLIHYYADSPDADGKSVSFCLWTNPDEARRISRDSRHAAATRMINLYTSYTLEKYDVHHDGQDVSLVEHQ